LTSPIAYFPENSANMVDRRVMSHGNRHAQRAPVVVTALVLSMLAGSSCQPRPAGSDTYVFEGETMGTTYTVKVVSKSLDPTALDRIKTLIGEELEDVNRKMSHYREDSELSRFNRHRDLAPFTVSPQTFRVFQEAESISRLTDGAFDVTAAPLIGRRPAARSAGRRRRRGGLPGG